MKWIDVDALRDYFKTFDIGCGCSEDYQTSFLKAIDEQQPVTIESVTNREQK